MKRFVILVAFCLPVISFAQYAESEVISFLTADAYKLWIFDQHKIVMSGSDDCDKGEAYTFFKAGKKVIHQKCIDKKWEKKEYTWKLDKDSPHDWWITFNGKKYYLVMTDYTSYEELKLRQLDDPGSKIAEAHDIVLKFLKDE